MKQNINIKKFEVRQVIPFNSDWRFAKGDFESAEQPCFDDSLWRELDIPHDWSIVRFGLQLGCTYARRSSKVNIALVISWRTAHAKHFTSILRRCHARFGLENLAEMAMVRIADLRSDVINTQRMVGE